MEEDIWKETNDKLMEEANQILSPDGELKDHIRSLFMKKDIVFTIKYYRLALKQTGIGLLQAKRDVFEICEDLLNEFQKQDLERIRNEKL